MRAGERATLLAWLNRGIRDGRTARLESEFPTALFSGNTAQDLRNHIVVRCNGRFASHVLVHTIPVEAVGKNLKLGMIGMVYTDPAFRGRGAAKIALERAIAQLKEDGTALTILWSDLDAFYARVGFHRAGVENFYLLGREHCRDMCGMSLGELEVRNAASTDWQYLERLYAAKPSRHQRPAGRLARLAAAPDSETLVAVRAGTPVAYATMGRGDDLTGVVHEWAGGARGLMACLNRFFEVRSEITLLEGPIHERATRPLRSAGACPHPGSLGLMRILDAEKLWAMLANGVPALAGMQLVENESAETSFTFSTTRRSFTLSHQSALSFLFGPSMPRTLQLGLEPDEREVLHKRLPLPLFIWGFDSI